MAFTAKEREDTLARQQGGRHTAKLDGRFASGGVPFGLRWAHLGKDYKNRGYWEVNEDQVIVLKGSVKSARSAKQNPCLKYSKAHRGKRLPVKNRILQYSITQYSIPTRQPFQEQAVKSDHTQRKCLSHAQ